MNLLNSVPPSLQIQRPLSEINNDSLAMDLLWSDPDGRRNSGYGPNLLRGVSVAFAVDAVHRALRDMNLDLIVRAHQGRRNGQSLFGVRAMVTIFSSSRYNPDEVGQENGNAVLVLRVWVKSRSGVDCSPGVKSFARHDCFWN